jgi:hypothetical protein
VRRFIPNFVEIVKPLNRLLNNYSHFEWENEGKLSFQHIKEVITIVPILVSPNFTKDFIIFSFASKDTIESILLQKNDQGDEKPITFKRKNIRESNLNYTITEKQAYALFKSLKHF